MCIHYSIVVVFPLYKDDETTNDRTFGVMCGNASFGPRQVVPAGPLFRFSFWPPPFLYGTYRNLSLMVAMDCFVRTSECLIIYIYNRSAKKSESLLLLKGRRTTYTRKSIMLGILLCNLYYFLTVLHSIRLPIHKNSIHRVTLSNSLHSYFSFGIHFNSGAYILQEEIRETSLLTDSPQSTQPPQHYS